MYMKVRYGTTPPSPTCLSPPKHAVYLRRLNRAAPRERPIPISPPSQCPHATLVRYLAQTRSRARPNSSLTTFIPVHPLHPRTPPPPPVAHT
jgi:hypothetical protein